MAQIKGHWRKSASLGAIVSVALLAGTQLGSSGPPGPTAPVYAHSWYISNFDFTTMWHLGYNDAQRDDASCTNSLVVLDFGQPDKFPPQGPDAYGGYGAWNYDSPTSASQLVSDFDIELAAEDYARGWYTGTGNCPRLHIVVGTNNYDQIPTGSGSEIGGTPGQAGFWWSAVGGSLQGFLSGSSNPNYSWQITAWTGDDMEQPCYSADSGLLPVCPDPQHLQRWDCANVGSKTRAFVDGYGYNTSAPILLDYGTAWVPNPAPRYLGDPSAGTCWSANDATGSNDVYYVAYQKPSDWPLPEIYTTQATDSWIDVRRWHSVYFKGVMTECPQGDLVPSNCLTSQLNPAQAWYDLWNKLNANGYGQSSLDYATNIQYENR